MITSTLVLTSVGDDTGVILPDDVLEKLGVEPGGSLNVSETSRGFDHGVFIPLKLAFPEAQLPTVQLSLRAGLDPAEHLALGKALAPLRDEGVLIIGSGMSYHNMRGFNSRQAGEESKRFDTL